jgi:hypothetical protein
MNIALVVLSGALLFLEFDTNAWKVVSSEWFWTHQRSTESWVVARMVLSRQDGIFSEAGLPGLGSLDSSPPSYAAIPDRDQYRAYIKGLPFERYSPYKSQVGAQGILFSCLDRLIPSSPRTKLRLFHGFNSFLSAVVLAFIILWFRAGLDRGLAMAGRHCPQPVVVGLGFLSAHARGDVLLKPEAPPVGPSRLDAGRPYGRIPIRQVPVQRL